MRLDGTGNWITKGNCSWPLRGQPDLKGDWPAGAETKQMERYHNGKNGCPTVGKLRGAEHDVVL